MALHTTHRTTYSLPGHLLHVRKAGKLVSLAPLRHFSNGPLVLGLRLGGTTNDCAGNARVVSFKVRGSHCTSRLGRLTRVIHNHGAVPPGRCARSVTIRGMALVTYNLDWSL